MSGMKFSGWGAPDKTFVTEDKPKLWPFIRETLGMDPEHRSTPVDWDTIPVAAPRIDERFSAALKGIVGETNIFADRQVRLRHAMGKSYRDLLRARTGQLGRIPDLVVTPGSHEEVEALLRAADEHGVKVIPFGGGTNIVGGVEVSPAVEGPAITVSLRRMKRLLSIDAESLTATMEAGMLGPEIEDALNRAGYSLGHFPDSFEFSTLGGWLATRSAGMQSDLYGKIEDMVVALKMATPQGTIATANVPKAAAGPDLNQIVVGSEGVLGIITEATMQIHRLAGREYRGILFPDFRSGAEFMRTCVQERYGASTVRLSNDQETALGFAMKKTSTPFQGFVQRAFKLHLTKVRRFKMEGACLLIAGLEGSAREIGQKRRPLLALARKFGGVDLGTSVGDRWFAGKYDYPYLRDAVMDHGCMADVTETAVPWSQVVPIHEKVKAAMHAHLRRGASPGYVGCHISHSYPSGACLYFTFGTAQQKGDELGQYLRAKKTIVDVLVEAGAALSHHHAIGYEHLPWMERYLGPCGIKVLAGLKAALDPRDTCNPGKLIPGPAAALDQFWPALSS
jgi:alkyldihydroxyacetonephosphate synthase